MTLQKWRISSKVDRTWVQRSCASKVWNLVIAQFIAQVAPASNAIGSTIYHQLQDNSSKRDQEPKEKVLDLVVKSNIMVVYASEI